MSNQQLAKSYAQRIRRAVASTRIAGVKQAGDASGIDWAHSNVGQEIASVGSEIEGLVYQINDRPISEETKDEIVDLIAEELGFSQPKKLRRMLKEGSVDALHRVNQDVAGLAQHLGMGTSGTSGQSNPSPHYGQSNQGQSSQRSTNQSNQDRRRRD